MLSLTSLTTTTTSKQCKCIHPHPDLFIDITKYNHSINEQK